MIATKPQPPASHWTPRRIAGLLAWLLVLTAMPVAAYRWWNHPGVLTGLACSYIAIGVGLRSRLIVCTLIGVALGAMFDSGPKRGNVVDQTWQTIWHMAAGLAIGITVGLAWDYSESTVVDIGKTRRHNASAKRR